jgi:hypothetical protein
MNIQEIKEGRVKDLAYNLEWERQHSAGPTPSHTQLNYNVTINGKVWKAFPTEPEAMRAAKSLYNKNPRLRISVGPH